MESKKISPAWTLMALAISAFAIGSTEFISVGIMPLIVESFGVSLSTAGLTVSLYALGVTIGAPLLTLLTNRLNRKTLLIYIMLGFVIGNILAASAPNFTILLIGRIVTALSHGIFMAVSSVIAADVVEPNKRASAISIMFTGLTVATVTGVPLGTFIGQTFFWRGSFIFLIVLGLIGLISSILLVPNNLPLPLHTDYKGIWRILKQPQLLLIIIITALGYGATYPAYTYISEILHNNMSWSSSAIVVILIGYGFAVAVGNTLGGRFANKNPLSALIYMFGGLAIALFFLIFAMNSHYLGLIAVLLLGIFAFMNVPGLQLYMLQLSENYTPEDVSLASSLNISAFNIGIMFGSTMGGQAASANLLSLTPLIGIIMLVVGISLTFILKFKEQR
ncbi:MFS transporter [Lactobacillus terrae]|uniref:MFS transporter n=1 Tax=Lactobacillus terrae TaxID=2269374 RepID=UPI000C1B782C|nr:MFS transporter [Lactobacillus terrae]